MGHGTYGVCERGKANARHSLFDGSPSPGCCCGCPAPFARVSSVAFLFRRHLHGLVPRLSPRRHRNPPSPPLPPAAIPPAATCNPLSSSHRSTYHISPSNNASYPSSPLSPVYPSLRTTLHPHPLRLPRTDPSATSVPPRFIARVLALNKSHPQATVKEALVPTGIVL